MLDLYFGILLVFVYLALVGISIADYIIKSLSLYRIAQRRGIENAWMVWLPFASDYAIGKIAAEYDERNGHKRKWGTVLLTFSVLAVVSVVIMYVIMIAMVLMLGVYADESAVVSTVIFTYIFAIICALAATGLMVCRTVCIYKIFESTVPEKALKYLLVYSLVPLGGAICLFKSKEGGYTKPPLYMSLGAYGSYNGYGSAAPTQNPQEQNPGQNDGNNIQQ